MNNDKVSIFWYRRDLRLEDNTALDYALRSGFPVVTVFIFDNNITKELPENDARISFIYDALRSINKKLISYGSSLNIYKGDPLSIWQNIIREFSVTNVYFNNDYEPYSDKRDKEVTNFLKSNKINVFSFKDQVIFEGNEILKSDGKPYTIYTPYKNKWLQEFDKKQKAISEKTENEMFFKSNFAFPDIIDIGFKRSKIRVQDYDLSMLDKYHLTRDIPYLDSTSRLGPHLRFGTVSIRKIVKQAKAHRSFLEELIWREFFMQILFHFPKVVTQNFKSKYDGIEWRNNKGEYNNWCEGKTGYPMVDAGMRQLNNTGYMHNRIRMITAGFLCKHLLVDWRWGEAYFAERLLDYELSSNNGNWQWAAGTGCDAAPYFRVFNPETQLKKFDKDHKYIRKWIPEFDSGKYEQPIVDHKFARERAIAAYKNGLKNK